MKLPMILKQEENKKSPVDKKLEQNEWLKRCTNFERVSFLQWRRNQMVITSPSKALVEELSKKTGVIELTTTFCSPDSFQFCWI